MKELLYTFLAVSIIFSGCEEEATVPANMNNNNSGNNTNLSIGDFHQGGIIFYFDGNGGGLMAAPPDSLTGDTTALWGCYLDTIAGANGTAIGTGFQNTIDIEAGCSTSGTASDICTNLTLGGHNDWFLPSKDELNEMYLNLRIQGFGGLDGGYYWSSTEYDSGNAWLQAFYDTSTNGFQAEADKSIRHSVRAIRAF